MNESNRTRACERKERVKKKEVADMKERKAEGGGARGRSSLKTATNKAEPEWQQKAAIEKRLEEEVKAKGGSKGDEEDNQAGND